MESAFFFVCRDRETQRSRKKWATLKPRVSGFSISRNAINQLSISGEKPIAKRIDRMQIRQTNRRLINLSNKASSRNRGKSIERAK